MDHASGADAAGTSSPPPRTSRSVNRAISPRSSSVSWQAAASRRCNSPVSEPIGHLLAPIRNGRRRTALMVTAPAVAVPSLFRQTLISTTERREPTTSETPAHAAYSQVRPQLPGVRAVLRHDGSAPAQCAMFLTLKRQQGGQSGVPVACPIGRQIRVVHSHSRTSQMAANLNTRSLTPGVKRPPKRSVA
jgi:hypothetical protein